MCERAEATVVSPGYSHKVTVTETESRLVKTAHESTDDVQAIG
jgi:hypothetical protein